MCAPTMMDPWQPPATDDPAEQDVVPFQGNPRFIMPVNDPLIFPGLYCPTGLDVMGLLLQVRARPHAVIDLGPIDCSVSLTLCDLELPDAPVVYASDAFYQMTGYSPREIIGRNCRFLQQPPGGSMSITNKNAARQMSQALFHEHEIQLQVDNYRKNGQHFRNILTIIPIHLGHIPRSYAVGFQSEA